MYSGTDKYAGGITGEEAEEEEQGLDLSDVLATSSAEETVVVQVKTPYIQYY